MNKRLKFKKNGARDKLKIILAISLGLSAVLSPVIIPGQAQAEAAVETITKRIQGEVSAVSKNFIAVIYRQDKQRGNEEEIALPIATDYKLEHKRRLTDIKAGDTVRVTYEEIMEIYEEVKDKIRVKKSRILNRKAKVISFVRSKPKDRRYEEIKWEEDVSFTSTGKKSIITW